MARGKVITTHLRTGDPNGIRTVFISNKICEMIVFPKSEFEQVGKLEESSRPALYILLGEDENGSAQAYIGESTNGLKRINNHKTNKLFWNKCLMFVAKDESINMADVQYLERRAMELAIDCARFGVMNEQSGKEISLSNYQIDIMEEFFDDVRLLASFIGCPIFEKGDVLKNGKVSNLFHLTIRGANAHAIFDENDHSMRILKGSLLPQDTVPSYRDGDKRNQVIAAMSKATKDGMWELQRDYTINSPSTAASYCSGRSCNGWKEWTSEDGKSLDELYRSEYNT